MILRLGSVEKQKQFLTDTHRYVAYGGARGGGNRGRFSVNQFFFV